VPAAGLVALAARRQTGTIWWVNLSVSGRPEKRLYVPAMAATGRFAGRAAGSAQT
jgi:hypothetical protein